jgi:transglutaminase-like putative cysteine protease
MKKTVLLVLSVAVLGLTACGSSTKTEYVYYGQSLFNLARQKEQAGAYITAYKLYTEAQPILRQEGDTALLKECGQGLKRTSIITADFSSTEKDIRNTFAQRFPGVTEEHMKYLISRVAYLDIEGTRLYYYDYINTIYNIDLDLMKLVPEEMARERQGYSLIEPFVNRPGPTSGSPYRDPHSYQATATYNIPLWTLPRTGVLKIWQPVAINTDCQTDLSLVSATPAGYVKNPPTFNGNLGDMYLEVPLDGLTGSVRMEIKFNFKHWEQRFTMIDPNNVGTYDKNSELYREFTTSRGNIFISPEIAAKAREVVGSEQNPYRAARKLYDYVVDDLTYSHLPHGSIAVLNIPESVWVHTHNYGDCGAQSIYFSALCRAVGIPARTTGGYQLFPGMEGNHFWAEFYLPNYGWVPADTSLGQVCKYLPELTEAQKKAWKDYFFGSMDPYRMVIQKDVDYPFAPPAPEPTAISGWLQSPAVLCDSMDGLPEQPVWEHYNMSFTAAP